ncbi:hypothetical protein MKC93_22555, partial [[Clostridium] innocuum]|nr:hypothetical protein [[Clostridium] innocuum]
YITYYNAVQHTYNKIKRKFDIKKALHKRHLEYLRFYNCRTTEVKHISGDNIWTGSSEDSTLPGNLTHLWMGLFLFGISLLL